MNEDVILGADVEQIPAGLNGTAEYINMKGELKLDESRLVDANVELTDVDTPATDDSIGGVDFVLNVNGHPAWRKRVRLLLNAKPDDMSIEAWQQAINLVVRQQEEIINP